MSFSCNFCLFFIMVITSPQTGGFFILSRLSFWGVWNLNRGILKSFCNLNSIQSQIEQFETRSPWNWVFKKIQSSCCYNHFLRMTSQQLTNIINAIISYQSHKTAIISLQICCSVYMKLGGFSISFHKCFIPG